MTEFTWEIGKSLASQLAKYVLSQSQIEEYRLNIENAETFARYDVSVVYEDYYGYGTKIEMSIQFSYNHRYCIVDIHTCPGDQDMIAFELCENEGRWVVKDEEGTIIVQ